MRPGCPCRAAPPSPRRARLSAAGRAPASTCTTDRARTRPGVRRAKARAQILLRGAAERRRSDPELRPEIPDHGGPPDRRPDARSGSDLPGRFHGIPGMPNFSCDFHALPLIRGRPPRPLLRERAPGAQPEGPRKTDRAQATHKRQASGGVRSRVALAECCAATRRAGDRALPPRRTWTHCCPPGRRGGADPPAAMALAARSWRPRETGARACGKPASATRAWTDRRRRRRAGPLQRSEALGQCSTVGRETMEKPALIS